MKFAADRPYSDPEKAARKVIEIANSVEPVQRVARQREGSDVQHLSGPARRFEVLAL
jgi:hypothetical protein